MGAWVTAARVRVATGAVSQIRLSGYAEPSQPITAWDSGRPAWSAVERAIQVAGLVDVFLWYQGESDALAGPDAITRYRDRLVDLMRRVRLASANPSLLVVVCGLADYSEAETAYAALRAQQMAAVQSDPRARYLSTQGLPHDGQHLTVAGYQGLAVRLAEMLRH